MSQTKRQRELLYMQYSFLILYSNNTSTWNLMYHMSGFFPFIKTKTSTTTNQNLQS